MLRKYIEFENKDEEEGEEGEEEIEDPEEEKHIKEKLKSLRSSSEFKIEERTQVKQTVNSNLHETLDLRVDDTVHREAILDPDNARWTEEKTEDYKDISLFRNVSPIGDKNGANKNIQDENENEIKEEDDEEDDEDDNSIPDIHKNPIMNKNTDTFQVSATGDSKIDSFVLVNSSYDATSRIKKVERNLINDTYIAQQEKGDDLGVDFSLVSPKKDDIRGVKEEKRLEEIKETPKSSFENSASPLRESLEKERLKIESVKKNSDESEKLTESFLKINENLQAKIKRKNEDKETDSRFTVCFLRRTPGSVQKSSQVKKEYTEKKSELEKLQTSEFNPSEKKPAIPLPSKKRKMGI